MAFIQFVLVLSIGLVGVCTDAEGQTRQGTGGATAERVGDPLPRLTDSFLSTGDWSTDPQLYVREFGYGSKPVIACVGIIIGDHDFIDFGGGIRKWTQDNSAVALTIIERAGHLLWLDQPVALAEALPPPAGNGHRGAPMTPGLSTAAAHLPDITIRGESESESAQPWQVSIIRSPATATTTRDFRP